MPRLPVRLRARLLRGDAGAGGMRLAELSEGYLLSAELLRNKLRLLRACLRAAETAQERASIRHEIALLAPILAQCYELAELTTHYYERSFYRSEKYTL